MSRFVAIALAVFTATQSVNSQLFSGSLVNRQSTQFVGNFQPTGRYQVYDVAIFSNSIAMICVEGGVGRRAKFIPFDGEPSKRVARVSHPLVTVDMLNAGIESEYVVEESDILITNGVLHLYHNTDNEVVLSDFIIQFKPIKENP